MGAQTETADEAGRVMAVARGSGGGGGVGEEVSGRESDAPGSVNSRGATSRHACAPLPQTAGAEHRHREEGKRKRGGDLPPAIMQRRSRGGIGMKTGGVCM